MKSLPSSCSIYKYIYNYIGFPGSSAGKESTCNARDPSLIPELGRSPGEGIGYPLKYSWASLVAQKVKNPPAKRVDLGSIPELVRSPGGGHGNPLQYSCLENSMNRGGWLGGLQSMGSQRMERDFHFHFSFWVFFWVERGTSSCADFLVIE